jgi:hypothetical protein
MLCMASVLHAFHALCVYVRVRARVSWTALAILLLLRARILLLLLLLLLLQIHQCLTSDVQHTQVWHAWCCCQQICSTQRRAPRHIQTLPLAVSKRMQHCWCELTAPPGCVGGSTDSCYNIRYGVTCNNLSHW